MCLELQVAQRGFRHDTVLPHGKILPFICMRHSQLPIPAEDTCFLNLKSRACFKCRYGNRTGKRGCESRFSPKGDSCSNAPKLVCDGWAFREATEKPFYNVEHRSITFLMNRSCILHRSKAWLWFREGLCRLHRIRRYPGIRVALCIASRRSESFEPLVRLA